MKGKILLFILVACILSSRQGLAEFNLSVVPYEGGRNLRFGRITASSTVTKEVKIRITSDEATQYRLSQGLMEPLTNEQGGILPEEAIKFYTARGTNAFGSLYQDTPRVLERGKDILYTSSRQGESDSFDIIYSLDGSKLSDSGYFRGKIVYTLESAGGNRFQTFVLDIDLDARIAFDVSIESLTGTNKVRLDTKTKNMLKGGLVCNINAPSGRNIELYQRLDSFPENEKGEIIDIKALRLITQGAQKGELSHTTADLLKEGEVLLYSSSGGNDSFQIIFSLDEGLIHNLEAGTYRGRLLYYLKGSDYEKIFPIDLEIDVENVFTIEVDAKEGFSFPSIRPNLPPQERKVIIEVKSNLNQPYEVIQTVTGPLTDEKGNSIPAKYFTMKGQMPGDESGEIRFTQYSPVKPGDEIVYTSDTKGNPASFQITYRLSPSLDITVGDYTTQIMYTLLRR